MNETNHPSSLATCTLIQDFLGVKDGGIYEAVVQLKQQLDAVVAENVALKKFCKNAAFDADYIAELEMQRGGFTDALNDIKTPATDAALAEVEAKAIDNAIERITSFMKHPEVSQVVSTLGMFVDVLEAFKKELREGRA